MRSTPLHRRFLDRARRAFTLVELMIAIAISAFVVSALYALFVGQMRQFMYQDLQMEMHQSMRLGMDILTRSARMAGYGSGASTLGPFGDGGDPNAELSSVIAYDGTGPNGSDAVTFVSMDPSLVFNTFEASPQPCSTTSLNVVPSVNDHATKLSQLQNGELVQCVDYAAIGDPTSYLFGLTAAPNASTGAITIGDNTAYGDFANACGSTANLPLIMTCSRAEVATFYIDANDGDGIGAGSAAHPVLMMDLDFESPDDDDIPVVDNVEDFQVAYCVRPTGSNTECLDSGTDWYNSISSADLDNLYMVRMTLVVRSSRQDLRRTFAGAPVTVENNTVGSGTDNYYRQVLTAHVNVRNVRLQTGT